MAAAFPLATAAVGAFGGASGGTPFAPGGPRSDASAYRSAGINVGSRVVGRGNASTDGQTSRETQSAAATSRPEYDQSGFGGGGMAPGSGAWYSRPGVIAAALGVAVLLLLGLVLVARKSSKKSKEK